MQRRMQVYLQRKADKSKETENKPIELEIRIYYVSVCIYLYIFYIGKLHYTFPDIQK